MIKKVLLSLGLFGLFGISFVYGYLGTYIELDTNVGGYIGNNYYIPDEYLNFQYSGYIGFADTCGFSSKPFLYYWTENGLTFYNDGNNPGHQFVFTGVCITNYNSSNYDNLQYCNIYTGDVYNDFYNKNLTFTKVIYNGIGNYHGCPVPNQTYYSTLCFIDTNNIAYCFGGNRQYTTYGYYTGTIYSNISDIIEYYGTDSPFNGGGGFIPENGFPNTNRGVFDSYAEEGYVLKWCYSDFALNDLAISTGGIYQFYETNLEDGVYYTGATVLDLFIEYGYGNSFESFFDYWYNTYSQSLKTDSPSKYVGLSKGLWNMSNKYYYAGLSNRYIDYTKLYNYCSYFVDFDGDWDGDYTGPELPSSVSNNLSQPSSAVEYLSGFIQNQLSSGNNQNFDADSFFTSLTTKFDRLLNNINGSFIGIIPGYILAIMMALIFIRIISH